MIETINNSASPEVTISPSARDYAIEIQPAPVVRFSRITALQGDITMALAAPRLRWKRRFRQKRIALNSPTRQLDVVLWTSWESQEFRSSTSPVTMALGREASG